MVQEVRWKVYGNPEDAIVDPYPKEGSMRYPKVCNFPSKRDRVGKSMDVRSMLLGQWLQGRWTIRLMNHKVDGHKVNGHKIDNLV